MALANVLYGLCTVAFGFAAYFTLMFRNGEAVAPQMIVSAAAFLILAIIAYRKGEGNENRRS